jgi:hypothetical protein
VFFLSASTNLVKALAALAALPLFLPCLAAELSLGQHSSLDKTQSSTSPTATLVARDKGNGTLHAADTPETKDEDLDTGKGFFAAETRDADADDDDAALEAGSAMSMPEIAADDAAAIVDGGKGYAAAAEFTIEVFVEIGSGVSFAETMEVLRDDDEVGNG